MAMNGNGETLQAAFLKIQKRGLLLMASCSILPSFFFPFFFFEEAIQEFNPQNIISLPSSCEQNGQHSSLTRKKEEGEDEEENTILFRRSTSAFCDNPNPLLAG